MPILFSFGCTDNSGTVGGYKLDHLIINTSTAVAAEARVNPALPATAVVEIMAKWLKMYPRTVVVKEQSSLDCVNKCPQKPCASIHQKPPRDGKYSQLPSTKAISLIKSQNPKF